MAIITVSREMGTGAYEVSKEIAKRLKYTLVDGAKIIELAPQYGISEEVVQRIDEKPPAYITAEDRLHAAHLNMIELIILDCVKAGNAIIYGRGGQDLLAGMGNMLRLRFIAPFEERVERFAEREWIDPDLARELIRKSDHQRGGFIHFYFDRDWNDPMEYDLVFNTSRISKASIVETVVSAAKDPKIKGAEDESAELLENIILCKKVETEILKSGEVLHPHFKIFAESGEVTLVGHVHSDAEAEAAVEVASAVAGVDYVVNRLQVFGYRNYRG